MYFADKYMEYRVWAQCTYLEQAAARDAQLVEVQEQVGGAVVAARQRGELLGDVMRRVAYAALYRTLAPVQALSSGLCY